MQTIVKKEEENMEYNIYQIDIISIYWAFTAIVTMWDKDYETYTIV